MKNTWLLLVLLSLCSSAFAEPLQPNVAMERLVGKTWSGINDSGSKFWFWHEGDANEGEFAAKFVKLGAKYYEGKWKIVDNKVC